MHWNISKCDSMLWLNAKKSFIRDSVYRTYGMCCPIYSQFSSTHTLFFSPSPATFICIFPLRRLEAASPCEHPIAEFPVRDSAEGSLVWFWPRRAFWLCFNYQFSIFFCLLLESWISVLLLSRSWWNNILSHISIGICFRENSFKYKFHKTPVM